MQRFGAALPSERWIVPRAKPAEFVAGAVLGNVRAFVFVCNRLLEACEREPLLRPGVGQLGETLIAQAREYCWPLIEEVRPRLGRYESMVAAAQTLAAGLYVAAADARRCSVVILREHVERLAKPLEILEYCGFVTRREASIGMKSVGRGARFSLNLCNLLERMPGSRLTSELFDHMDGARPGVVGTAPRDRLTAGPEPPGGTRRGRPDDSRAPPGDAAEVECLPLRPDRRQGRRPP